MRWLAGCLVVAAATLVPPGTPAEAAFPGRNGVIAFQGHFVDCGFEEYAIGTIRPSGTDRRQITDCESIWFGPDWSPSGEWLMYSGQHQVRRLDVGSAAPPRDVATGQAPSLAPDGQRFVYRRGPLGRDVWRARIDGGDARLLRARERGSPPLWSPDGRSIAYLRLGKAGGVKGFRLISARTGDRIHEGLGRLWGAKLVPIDWSPDGRSLLAERTLVGARNLYVVSTDTTAARRSVFRGDFLDAAWSPDGRRIVVVARAPSGPFDFRRRMLTMSTRGTRVRVIWETALIGNEDPGNAPLSVTWQPLPESRSQAAAHAR